jgi:replicative DNA helicase
LNLPSALIKQVLELSDFDTWARVRKHYLPAEYHQLFDAIDKHVTKYHKLPKVGELKLSVRDSNTLDKVYALDAIVTDAEPFLLLDYVKNEYAQKEALFQLDRWVDRTVAFESAEEVVKSLQNISYDLEQKVEIQPENESMQKLSLFESEEEFGRHITLGLNAAFDAQYDFLGNDFIMMGGKRGSGKSITCNNLAKRCIESGKTAIYYSIEMDGRQVLQRHVAIMTSIPYSKIRNKNLSVTEWHTIAKFWASRYENGDKHLQTYLIHNDFDLFHKAISRENLTGPQLEIVYDPHLTISKMRAHTNKLIAMGVEVGLTIVDYLNQMEAQNANGTSGMYDWKQQIENSKALKLYAQDYQIPTFSPYQTDASGEARFAKGILDAADAAMVLEAHDNCISFKVTKMRNADDDVVFTSAMNWDTLQIGPESAEPPEPEVEDEENAPKKRKGKSGFAGAKKDIYDDPPF